MFKKIAKGLILSQIALIGLVVVFTVSIGGGFDTSSETTDGNPAINWIGEYGDPTLNNKVPLLFYPIKSKIITSPFGDRYDPVSGKLSTHRGVDYGCSPKDEPVRASASGKVSEVTSGCVPGDKKCGYKWGNFVKINHDNGVSTLYAHLTEPTVKVGDEVQTGETIGTCGDTGWSTGYHVHLELYINGIRYNASPYLRYTDKYKSN